MFLERILLARSAGLLLKTLAFAIVFSAGSTASLAQDKSQNPLVKETASVNANGSGGIDLHGRSIHGHPAFLVTDPLQLKFCQITPEQKVKLEANLRQLKRDLDSEEENQVAWETDSYAEYDRRGWSILSKKQMVLHERFFSLMARAPRELGILEQLLTAGDLKSVSPTQNKKFRAVKERWLEWADKAFPTDLSVPKNGLVDFSTEYWEQKDQREEMVRSEMLQVLDPAQRSRFEQLELQCELRDSPLMFFSDRPSRWKPKTIQEELKLTESQLKKFNRIEDILRDDFINFRWRCFPDPSTPSDRELFDEILSDHWDQCLKVLTDVQETAIKTRLGAPGNIIKQTWLAEFIADEKSANKLQK